MINENVVDGIEYAVDLESLYIYPEKELSEKELWEMAKAKLKEAIENKDIKIVNIEKL